MSACKVPYGHVGCRGMQLLQPQKQLLLMFPTTATAMRVTVGAAVTSALTMVDGRSGVAGCRCSSSFRRCCKHPYPKMSALTVLEGFVVGRKRIS
eukprot:scaffold192965_cov18-Tisochrysis_lutea.AAC.1